jgi:hypothetical protein
MALALALAAGASHAASVRGVFLGADSKAPLEGAEVVLRRAADSTVVAHTTTGAERRLPRRQPRRSTATSCARR